MRLHASVACASVAGLLLLFACSSSHRSEIGPAETIDGGATSTSSTSSSGSSIVVTATPPLAPCTALASRTCEIEFRCVPGTLLGRDDVLAACKAREDIVCNRLEKLTGVTPAPAACAPAVGPFNCTDAPPDVPAACGPKGTLAKGGPCENDRQCLSGYCNATAGCGTCDDIVPANGSCTAGGRCADDLTCINGTCKPRGQEGSPCDSTSCAAPLYCSPATALCAAPLGANAPCDELHICDLSLALYCVAGTCQAATFVPLNETCGQFDNVARICIGSAGCNQASTLATSTCRREIDDGAACVPDGSTPNDGCHPHSSCVGERCTLDPLDACH